MFILVAIIMMFMLLLDLVGLMTFTALQLLLPLIIYLSVKFLGFILWLFFTLLFAIRFGK